MKPRHYFLLLALLLAAHLTGCRASKPPEPHRPDTTRTQPVRPVRPVQPAPVPVVKPPFFLSTPEGSARRQARKDSRAAIPRKLGKGAVYAPKASEVVNAFKPRAAVINADSGAVVTAIEKVKAPLAIGAGATATSVTSKGLSWWLLILPVAWLGWRLYRKTLPFS